MGRRPADLLLRQVTLVNVLSGELLPSMDVAICGDRVAAVGHRLAIEAAVEEDGQGLYLLPGWIDAHAHADYLVNPVALAEELLPWGTTALLTYADDLVCSMGTAGLDYQLQASAQLPLAIYLALPPSAPCFPGLEGEDLLPAAELVRYLAHPRVLSLGEVLPWGRITAGDRTLLDKMALTRAVGKRVDGHCSAAREEELNALAAAGISSCHESMTAAEARQRLRLGMHVMLRHGSSRQDLPQLVDLIRGPNAADTSRVMLTPDYLSPEDILRHGYMNTVVGAAIALGVEPLRAVQMATINPATYMGLDGELGAVAPGWRADLQLVAGWEQLRPVLVVAGGQVVAREGKLTQSLGPYPSPLRRGMYSRLLPEGPVTPASFQIPAPAGCDSVTVTAMHLRSQNVTGRRTALVPVRDGCLDPAGAEGDLLLAVTTNKDRIGWARTWLLGFGALVDGLAASISVGPAKVVVLGRSPAGMAMAYQQLVEQGGGAVLVEGDSVTARLVLTIGGLQSDGSMAAMVSELEGLNQRLRAMGCPWPDPLFVVHFMTFASLPYLRLSPAGLLDARRQQVIPEELAGDGIC